MDQWIGNSLCLKTVCAIVAVLYSVSTYADGIPHSSGQGWSAMKSHVDNDVAEFMADQKVVGMTIAASQNGRLVFTFGYGNAMKSATKVTRMKRNTVTPIGSLIKASATGPAMVQLAKSRGFELSKIPIYGEKGILKDYDQQISHAYARFERIAGMALSRDDRTYTWYMDGTFSIGTSRDLDKHQGRRPYTTANGKKPRDIVSMAISGNGVVHTWYKDGSHSAGSSFDLDLNSPIQRDDSGKVQRVKLPSGQSMDNIVGIAIRKKDNRIIVWYDNGKLSAGSPLDFRISKSPGSSYSAPNREMRYGIVDIGMSTENQVFVWYANGKTSTGTANKLDKVRSLASYSSAPLGRINNPYYKITLQHILDHKAGFNGGGDIRGAVERYDVLEKNLKYREIHRHFLTTRPLMFEPGKGWSYSNHGFGLATVLVPAMWLHGNSFLGYMNKHYFNQMNLVGKVRPRGQTPRNDEAFLYDVVRDVGGVKKIKPRKHSDTSLSKSFLGLAAGGFSASAEDVLRMTNFLTKRYKWSDVDRMGWFNDNGKLHHDGATGGGASIAILYPKNYVSIEGRPLSNVQVALATNTGGIDGIALRRLASKIALAIPISNVPKNFSVSWGKRVQ